MYIIAEKNEHSKDFKDICFYTLYKNGYSYFLKFAVAPVEKIVKQY